VLYPTAFRRLDSISIQLYFYTYNVLGVLSGMFSLVKGISVRREVKEILKLRTTPLRPVGRLTGAGKGRPGLLYSGTYGEDSAREDSAYITNN